MLSKLRKQNYRFENIISVELEMKTYYRWFYLRISKGDSKYIRYKFASVYEKFERIISYFWQYQFYNPEN